MAAGYARANILVAVTTERLVVGATWRVALGIGFLGSFTTFSTYAYETVRLAEDGAIGLALVNAIIVIEVVDSAERIDAVLPKR